MPSQICGGANCDTNSQSSSAMAMALTLIQLPGCHLALSFAGIARMYVGPQAADEGLEDMGL